MLKETKEKKMSKKTHTTFSNAFEPCDVFIYEIYPRFIQQWPRARLFSGTIYSSVLFFSVRSSVVSLYSFERSPRTYILNLDCTFYFRSKFITHSHTHTWTIYVHVHGQSETESATACTANTDRHMHTHSIQRTRAATKKK